MAKWFSPFTVIYLTGVMGLKIVSNKNVLVRMLALSYRGDQANYLTRTDGHKRHEVHKVDVVISLSFE